MLRVMFVSKFKNLKFWQILWICSIDFVFFWLGIQNESIVWIIMRQRGVSSERRHSICCSVDSFYPRPVLASGYCRCLCLCVCINHLLVRTLTHHLFKLGSQNLVQRSKTPWLRPYCFGGQLTLTFKVKFNFKLKIDPILSLSKPLLNTYSS